MSLFVPETGFRRRLPRRCTLFFLLSLSVGIVSVSDGSARSTSPIAGLWVERESTESHYTPFIMSFHEDGRFEARRSLLRGNGREKFSGRWKFDGKHVVMSGLKAHHKQSYEHIPEKFKKCELKSKPNDLFFKRYLSCNYQDFGGLRYTPAAETKLMHEGTSMVAMGGDVHFMPRAAAIRISPGSTYGSEEYCRVRVLVDFPFYRQVCTKEIPGGGPVRVLARSPDPEHKGWYFIEYEHFTLSNLPTSYHSSR